MSTNLQTVAPRGIEPATVSINEPLILNSIANEISRALTYVTVAKIAYDMGQAERGASAYETAAEAEAEACRMTALLGHPARAIALKQLDGYRLVLQDAQQNNFPPSLRQPSLN
jgi:hypothetical protein